MRGQVRRMALYSMRSQTGGLGLDETRAGRAGRAGNGIELEGGTGLDGKGTRSD